MNRTLRIGIVGILFAILLIPKGSLAGDLPGGRLGLSKDPKMPDQLSFLTPRQNLSAQ